VHKHSSWQFELAVFHHINAFCICGLSLLCFPGQFILTIVMELVLDEEGNITFTVEKRLILSRYE
jgi:hypothetical protein